jgi:hypothetical protein
MVRPQFTDRVKGRDGKKYLISTIRYQQTEIGEIWETAVFDSRGFFTSAETQRYSTWMFDSVMAQASHVDVVRRVKNEAADVWMMPGDLIEKVRESTVKNFHIANARQYYEALEKEGPPQEDESTSPSTPAVQFSDDGEWWWDGQTWQLAYSEDRQWRWLGEGWEPVDPARSRYGPNSTEVEALLNRLEGLTVGEVESLAEIVKDPVWQEHFERVAEGAEAKGKRGGLLYEVDTAILVAHGIMRRKLIAFAIGSIFRPGSSSAGTAEAATAGALALVAKDLITAEEFAFLYAPMKILWERGAAEPKPAAVDDLKAPDDHVGLFGETFMAEPIESPHGRIEPGDRVKVENPNRAESPSAQDAFGRYLGTRVVDGKKRFVIQIARGPSYRERLETLSTDLTSGRGWYGFEVPVEDIGRMMKVTPDQQAPDD